MGHTVDLDRCEVVGVVDDDIAHELRVRIHLNGCGCEPRDVGLALHEDARDAVPV